METGCRSAIRTRLRYFKDAANDNLKMLETPVTLISSTSFASRLFQALEKTDIDARLLPRDTTRLLKQDEGAAQPETQHALKTISPRLVLKLAPEAIPAAQAVARIFAESTMLLKENDLRKDMSQYDPAILQSLADLSGYLWSPEAHRQMLTANLISDSKDNPLRVFAARYPELNGSEPLSLDQTKHLRGEMKKALLRDISGAELANALLSAHYGLLQGNQPLGPSGLALVPEPLRQDSDFVSTRDVVIKVLSVTGPLDRVQNPLARGRSAAGIDRLTEDFLAALEKHRLEDSNEARKMEAKNLHEATEDVLMDALVNFAQKVVTIANNDPLLKQYPDETTKAYVTVLQAVGNSILYQADEKEKKRKQRKDLKARRHLHQQAVRDAQRATLQNSMRLLQVWAEAEKKKKDDKKPGALLTDVDYFIKAVPKGDTELGEIRAWLQKEADEQQESLRRVRSAFSAASKARQKLEGSDLIHELGSQTADVEHAIFRASVAKALEEGKDGDTVSIIDIFRDQLGDPKSDKAEGWRKRCVTHLSQQIADLKQELESREASSAQVSNWLTQLSSSLIVMSESADDDAPIGLQATYELIAENLRLQHINAIMRGDSIESERLLRAINQTDTYRSGKLYIRPSVAFLRNSYPATELQGDASTLWTNMLDAQAVRSWPTYDKAKGAVVQNSIDKQYWQNINSIRLSGVSNTNYAVTKDDVGNWYVKGYANNTDKMIQSFKNVALFALGGGVRGTLASAATQAPAAGGLAATAAGKAAPATAASGTKTVLEKQYDLHTKEYLTRLLTIYRGLKTEIQGNEPRFTGLLRTAGLAALDEPVRGKAQSGGVKPSKDDLVPAFEKSATYEANKPTLKAMFDEKKDDEDKLDVAAVRKRIDLLISSALDYRAERKLAILASAKPASADNWLDEDAANRFVKGVSDAARDFVIQRSDKALQAGEDYEKGLTIIGQSAGLTTGK
jgi:hypothetical protein